MLKFFCATQAAIHLPASLVPIIVMAMRIVVHPLQRTRTSIIMPTPMRKSGTKRLFPTKLIPCMTGLRFGTKRFRATPQMKAPKIPSSPAQSAKRAEKTIIVITIRNPPRESVQRLKKRCAIHGKTPMMSTKVSTMRPASAHAERLAVEARCDLRIARTKRERVIVSIVPPIATLAALFFCTP